MFSILNSFSDNSQRSKRLRQLEQGRQARRSKGQTRRRKRKTRLALQREDHKIRQEDQSQGFKGQRSSKIYSRSARRDVDPDHVLFVSSDALRICRSCLQDFPKADSRSGGQKKRPFRSRPSDSVLRKVVRRWSSPADATRSREKRRRKRVGCRSSSILLLIEAVGGQRVSRTDEVDYRCPGQFSDGLETWMGFILVLELRRSRTGHWNLASVLQVSS